MMLKIYLLVFEFHELLVSVRKSNTFNHLLIKVITKNYYAGMLLIFQFVENENLLVIKYLMVINI